MKEIQIYNSDARNDFCNIFNSRIILILYILSEKKLRDKCPTRAQTIVIKEIMI